MTLLIPGISGRVELGARPKSAAASSLIVRRSIPASDRHAANCLRISPVANIQTSAATKSTRLAITKRMFRNNTIRDKSGSSLVAVLFSMTVVSSLLGVIFAVTTNQARLARSSVDRGAAIAHADAVLEHLFDEWRIAMISVPDAVERDAGLPTQALTLSLSAPTSIELPVPAGLMLQDWTVVAADPMLAPMAGPAMPPSRRTGPVPSCAAACITWREPRFPIRPRSLITR